MSLYNYTRQRYYVLENASATKNYGKAILAADFKTIIVDLDQNALDGNLVIAVSDQYDAPDVSQAEGPGNEFSTVSYTDTRNGVTYNAANPYNPMTSVPGGNGRFNVETTGARWVIANILNRSGGVVNKLIVNLYDNQ